LIEIRCAEIKLVDHSFIPHDVNIALFVSPKGSNSLRRRRDLANFFQHAIFPGNSPNAPGRVIPANINAVEGRIFVATIDVAASDGIPIFPFICEDRWDVEGALLSVAIREWLESFVNIPAVVLAL